MKKIKLLGLILAASTLGLSCVSFAGGSKSQEVKAAVDINDYSACETAYNNNNASGLLTALRNITAPGKAGSYAQLWTTYTSCYVRSDGKIFDYYSSITNYTPGGSAQGANYDSEGDSYNREHSIPKSWWGGAETNQGADPYIVVPTDGYVNNGRSNYTFGYVASASKTYSNSKLGSGKSDYGYTGTVFEPDDSVKGDFARIYFYAIAKYSNSYNWRSGDGSRNFSGNTNTNFGLTDYAVKLFTKWHNIDPVSDWEIGLNDRVSAIQGNRNPFIDHPEYTNVLWGTHKDATHYDHGSTTGLSISKTNVSLALNGTTTISATSSNSANISWSSSNTNVVTVSQAQAASGASITLTAKAAGTATITVTATINNQQVSKTCSVTVSSSQKTLSSIAVSGQKTQFKVDNPFTFGGTVTATFSDSSQEDVTANATFSGYDMDIAGNYTVTVSCTYAGLIKTTTYQISVTNSGPSGSGTYEGTYPYEDFGSTWTMTNYSNQNGYLRCPESGTTSVILIQDIFENLTIKSSVTVTITSGTYGNGTSPTSSSYSIYTSGALNTQVPATQSGTLPTSKTYTNAIYTVTQSNAALFGDDLAIKISRPSESYQQIRIKSIAVVFDYDSSIPAEPTSISASVSKTFYVGDTISSSDISVVTDTDLDVNDFFFDNEGYMFTYEDAQSGGALTNKIFADSISYESFSCSLVVQVQRKNHVSGPESPENVANYIMYEDTNNQCVTKLDIAMGYLNILSSSQRQEFATSDDYVISTARERLEAWAANRGKTINYNSATLVNASNSYGSADNAGNTTIIIIAAVAFSMVSISVCLINKKKRLTE